MSSKLDLLRTAIHDEALPLSERKQAVEHYITALVDAIPEPGEFDPDVIALMTPPKADGPLGDLHPRAWAIGNQSRGWSATGASVSQARKFIHERRRTELLKTVYQDRDRHNLEREAAAQRLLDSLPSLHMMRRNGVTAQRLVAEAR